MSINFPDSPSLNDTHTVGDKTWTWDGTAWNVVVGGVPTTISELTITNDLTVGGENVTPYTGRRNILYNGAMQVAQRGTSVTGVTTTGYRAVDRWNHVISGAGTWTHSVESDSPDGFANSIKLTCTTANASLGASAYNTFTQSLEGQDLQVFKKGTSSPESFTFSFWVKSNVTGTYILELYDNDNARQVSASYTISSSGVWEKKTITFSGDTTGAFGNDNGNSLSIQWWIGAGSDRSSGTLNTSWASITNANRVVGQANVASATSNYWQITGVQLEVGDKATPFEHRSFGEELALCQRYYEKSYAYDVVPGTSSTYQGSVVAYPFTTTSGRTLVSRTFSVAKRATPTVTIYSPADGSSGYWFEFGFGNRSGSTESHNMFTLNLKNTVVLAGTGELFTQWVAVAEL